jgi:hypothetical protein
MDERNFYAACCWILMLGFGMYIMNLKVREHDDKIEFLMDHAVVARETEARP